MGWPDTLQFTSATDERIFMKFYGLAESRIWPTSQISVTIYDSGSGSWIRFNLGIFNDFLKSIFGRVEPRSAKHENPRRRNALYTLVQKWRWRRSTTSYSSFNLSKRWPTFDQQTARADFLNFIVHFSPTVFSLSDVHVYNHNHQLHNNLTPGA